MKRTDHQDKLHRLLWVLGSLFFVAGFSFLGANKSLAACPTLPTDKGSLTTTASVPATSNYYIWSRDRTATSANTKYYLQVDANCALTVGGVALSPNTWTWVNYQNGSAASRMSVSLSSGSHTFKLYGLDPSVSVDRLLLTTDANCTPSGTGDNCVNSTATPPPVTVPPIGSPTQPTPPTSVSGPILVGSSDPSSKTTVKVDGKVVASGYGAVTLDTSKLTDGRHTVTIETVDRNGNKQVSQESIVVKNRVNLGERLYTGLYNALEHNRSLTIMVLSAIGLVAAATVGVGLYLLWIWRPWRRIPGLRNLLDRRSKTAVVDPQRTQIGLMDNSWLGRFLSHPGSKWFVLSAFALVGSVSVLYSLAAATAFVVEPERGTPSGVTLVNDTSASGGAYMQFGSGTVATPTPPPPTPPPTGSGAKLLWSDEFNGSAGSDVNAADWTTVTGAPTNAGRVEYATPGTTNKQMDGKGNLVITARRQSYGGRDYTSARIEGTRPFTTGYAEYRAKMPVWPGLMPSTWLFNACGSNYPTSLCYQPDYAEIDLPEIVTGGKDADPTNARLTLHADFNHDHNGNNLWQRGWNLNTYNFAPQRVGDAWHRFGVYVSPSDHSVTFYIDGAPYIKYSEAETRAYIASQAYFSYQSDAVWPFGSKPLIPIIEIEIGGYSGTPDNSTNSDSLQVDYYRVYDKPPY